MKILMTLFLPMSIFSCQSSHQSAKKLLKEPTDHIKIEEEPAIWESLSLSNSSLETQIRVVYTKKGEKTQVGKVTWGKTSTDSSTPEVGFRPNYGNYYKIICEPGTPVEARIFVYNDSQRQLKSFGDMSAWLGKGATFSTRLTCPQGQRAVAKTFTRLVDNQGHTHRFKGILKIEGQ